MLFNLLNFGSGPQAIHYFVLCFVGTVGTMIAVAAQYRRRELVWVEGRGGLALGGVLVLASFVWFFATDEEIFIPGLAGGEFFTLFVAAFLVALPVTRLVAALLVRVKSVTIPSAEREEEPLV